MKGDYLGKLEYGCIVCIEKALANGKKEWPLYSRDHVVFKKHEIYCLKHAGSAVFK